MEFDPAEPATNSGRSLDFDTVRVSGPDFEEALVQVEVSYREPAILQPRGLKLGYPFYEHFEISVMQLNEMAAEKLRALAQRDKRETDLADLAVMLTDDEADDEVIAELAVKKFEKVTPGRANRIERIQAHLKGYAYTYDNEVPKLFP